MTIFVLSKLYQFSNRYESTCLFILAQCTCVIVLMNTNSFNCRSYCPSPSSKVWLLRCSCLSVRQLCQHTRHWPQWVGADSPGSVL